MGKKGGKGAGAQPKRAVAPAMDYMAEWIGPVAVALGQVEWFRIELFS